MAFVMQVSRHGRRLGISTTGGIVSGVKQAGGLSTAIEMAAQMWGPAMFETVSSQGDTLTNSGISIISSDSTSGTSPFFVSAPVQGVYKEIHFQTPATETVFNTSASTIFFNTTLAYGAAAGSTTVTVDGAASGTAGYLVLRGLSTTVWAVAGGTVVPTTS